MNQQMHTITAITVGIVVGATVCGPVSAAVSALTATPSTHPIYVNGQAVEMDAYQIVGSNYVKLRDIGQAVDFNVYWKNGVQIDTHTAYTGDPPTTSAFSDMEPISIEDSRNQIVTLTNRLRQNHDLPVLSTNNLLMQAAQLRAEEMAASSTYSHTRPDGSSYVTVTDCTYVAENINRIAQLYLEQQGKSLPVAAMESWSHSDDHLQNLLSERAASIGVGIAKGTGATGKDAWYCVQLFLYEGYTVHQVNASGN